MSRRLAHYLSYLDSLGPDWQSTDALMWPPRTDFPLVPAGEHGNRFPNLIGRGVHGGVPDRSSIGRAAVSQTRTSG